jgi:hypothetical protein
MAGSGAFASDADTSLPSRAEAWETSRGPLTVWTRWKGLAAIAVFLDRRLLQRDR